MDSYIINIYRNNSFFVKIKKVASYFGKIFGFRKNFNLKNTSPVKSSYKDAKKMGYVTYNNLPAKYSAITTLTKNQKILSVVLFLISSFCFFLDFKLSLIVLIGILTFLYSVDFLFTILVIYRSFGKKSEIRYGSEEVSGIDDSTLPKYTILCPLYHESEVIEQFTAGVEIIDWPKEKLEVILLLEEDDRKTINKAYDLRLPDYFRIEVVPDSLPKTKPKACNYGLLKATGDYIVVYDAEDKPDAIQLKKAYLAFNNLPGNVVCLQSKLNYYNQNQNFLTRLFTAEYSYWFDVALPGLQTLNTIIPLGGTSNHFKTDVLRKLEGWDPFNVTEDCDLGTRLFKEGYKTSVIDSVTLEEANSNLKSWIKQRSRWIKGYMQTYLVHMRNPIEFFVKHGRHALLFQLIIGMRMVFMLINPILWIMTILYFSLYPVVGPFIESLYPSYIFYPAVFCLVFANFTYFYSYMIGAAKKEKWELMAYIFMIPFYWLASSVAAGIAFNQLITKPFYWEKTKHGLHIEKDKEAEKDVVTIFTEPVVKPDRGHFAFTNIFRKVSEMISRWVYVTIPASVRRITAIDYKKLAFGGGVLIGANMLANFTNYLFNAVLGRNLSFENFGMASMISNLQMIFQIATGALFATVSYKSAILLGRRGGVRKDLWKNYRKKVFLIFLPITLILFFGVNYISPTPLTLMVSSAVFVSLLMSAVSAVDGGFLSGNQKFLYLASLVALAPLAKLSVGYLGLAAGNMTIVYFSQTAAILLSFLFGWLYISELKDEKTTQGVKEKIDFPKKFYLTSAMNRFSIAFFLSADVLLANLFLPGAEAGKYAILSLIGKMIYFLGSLVSQFVTPLIGKEIGEGRDGLKTFYRILPLSFTTIIIAFIFLGVFPEYFAVKLFGDKVYTILPYIFKYAVAISAFTVASIFALYHQTRKQYIFSYLGFLLSFAEILYITFFHESIEAFVYSIYRVSISYLICAVILHIAIVKRTSFAVNLSSFLLLFREIRIPVPGKNRENILIFNWRDTKHKWQGGAEVYIQEIAERFVKKGYGVTIMSSNDGSSKFEEHIGGVHILRRGGFFTLYIWAAFYYLIKLRGKYDFIVDCENGIPFFTPLYSRLPKILLIHHVHQQVFRENLPLPLALVAMFLESSVMRYVYRSTKIVTVSQSSKADILDLGLAGIQNIDIVNPGISLREFSVMKKYGTPTFSYLGRLMPYKNIDILLKAFKDVLKSVPNARLIIAGRGPNEAELQTLAKKLNIKESVDFLGYVTSAQKREIMGRSWFLVQPSSFEGWGITVTEANAAGTPVIASDTAGLRDSVMDGQTGILVKVGNKNELKRAIIGLITMDGYRSRLSQNAYEWSRHFSWNDSADKFLKIIIYEKDRVGNVLIPGLIYVEE